MPYIEKFDRNFKPSEMTLELQREYDRQRKRKSLARQHAAAPEQFKQKYGYVFGGVEQTKPELDTQALGRIHAKVCAAFPQYHPDGLAEIVNMVYRQIFPR